MHAWGDHLSPIMYLFVPAFRLVPGAPVLLVGQSVALALGALPVFGIARHRLRDERSAAGFAVLYLLNPSLHRWWPAQEQRAAYRVLAQVPPTASLSLQDRYVPHLSLRRVVTVFPPGLDRAE